MINMTNVQKPEPLRNHKRVAGTLPNDGNIEFIGIPQTLEVIWFQYGNQHSFKNLPQKYFNLLAASYHQDLAAVQDIGRMAYDYDRQVELYTYFMYGDADFTPDIVEDELQPAENYRHQVDCISIGWMTKDITLNGHALNKRDIKICDLLLANLPDKAIADELGIAHSTFDVHKRNLYRKANVDNKGAFLLQLINERI